MVSKSEAFTAPAPSPMPVDRDEWKKQLHLSNFVNTYCQFRDLQMFADCKSILIVGPGSGLDAHVLRWRGYEVTTLDIDRTFDPDVVGSVHDLHVISDGQFDAVIASHVLEHLAVPYLDVSLRELARVARFALIYLPVHGQHLQFRFIPGLRAIDVSIVLDLFNYFRRPDGITPRYMKGQHYWEVGMRGFRVRDLIRRFSTHFEVKSAYRNKYWLPSFNFILTSRSASSKTAKICPS